MFKRLLSIMLIITLVCPLLPVSAIAESVTASRQPLTQAEIKQTKALIAMGLGYSGWSEGDSITASSNARQMQEYLKWLLDQQLGNLDVKLQAATTEYDASDSDLQGTIQPLVPTLESLISQVTAYYDAIAEKRATISELLEEYQELPSDEQGSAAYDIRRAVKKLQKTMNEVVEKCGITNGSESFESQINDLESKIVGAANSVKSKRSILGGSDNLDAVENEAQMLEEAENAADFTFDIDVLSTSQFAIKVLNSSGDPIENANVEVSQKSTKLTGKTDAKGMAKFQILNLTTDDESNFTVNVVIEAKDYDTREVRQVHLKGGYVSTYRLSQSSVAYLRMASFNGIDVLTQQETIYYTKENDANLDLSLIPVTLNKEGGKIVLNYSTPESGSVSDSKTFVSGQEVTFTKDWCRTLSPGSSVSVKIKTDSGAEQTFPLQLVVEKAVVDKPISDINTAFSLLGNTFSFTLPDDMPFLGGSNLNIDLPEPKIKIYIDPSGDVMLGYGKSYTDPTLEWKSENSWDRQVVQDDAARAAAGDANAVEKGVFTGGTNKSSEFLGEAKAKFNVFASFRGKIAKQVSSVSQWAAALTGYVGVQGTFSADYTYTAWLGSVPVYAGLDVKFGLGAAVAMGLQWDWDSADHKFLGMSVTKGLGVAINILTEMGVSMGVGIKNIISAGVRFFGRMSASMLLGNPVSASVSLTMGLQFVIQLLFLKQVFPIWDGTFSSQSNAMSDESTSGTTTTIALDTTKEGAMLAAGSTDDVPNVKGGYLVAGTEIAQQLDSIAQEIQYVTLQYNGDNSTDNTYAFFIRPTGNSVRTAELVWWNLDNTALQGTVIMEGQTGTPTMRETTSDYAFSVVGEKDLAAVTVVGGYIYNDKKFEACSADVAVLEMQADGSLKVIQYELIRHAQTYASNEGFLAQPMVYLQKQDGKKGSDYYVTAGCAEMTDTGKQAAINAYFLSVERKNGEFKKYAMVSNKLEESDGMSAFAPATPSDKTLGGGGMTGKDTNSRVSYYSLGADTNLAGGSEPEDNGEGYRGDLYVNLNGTRKLIDDNVSFIPSMSTFNWIDNDGEFLFYLRREEGKDGLETYQLKSVCLNAGATEVTLQSYDIVIPSGMFYITCVEDSTQTGIPYLYWLESMEQAKEEGKKETSYRLRAVTFDRSVNVIYGPFTLAEFENAPNTAYISNRLALDQDGNGLLSLYYTVERTDSTDARVSQKVYKTSVSLKTGLEIIGIATEDPAVVPGSVANLVFTVKNIGNLPIRAFTMQLSQDGKKINTGTIVVVCSNPLPTENVSQYSDSLTDADSLANSVSRVSNLYDDLNGDAWVMTEKTISMIGAADDAESVSYKSTDYLMPEGLHTYRTSFMIPSNWQGVNTVDAELLAVYPAVRLQGGVANGEDEVVLSPTDQQLTVTEDSAEWFDDLENRSGYSIMKVEALTFDDAQDIGIGRSDMTLDCQTYADADGNQYVRVSIVNRGETGVDRVQGVQGEITNRLERKQSKTIRPTLTATVEGEGTQVLAHTFAWHITSDYAYSLDIPADLLLSGREGAKITFTINDNIQNENKAEFSEYDNSRTLMLGAHSPLSIVRQPESQSVRESDKADFAVEATGGWQPYEYQWQRMNASGEWENIIAATQAALTLLGVKTTDNGAAFRCVVTDAYGETIASETAELKVIAKTAETIPETGDTAQPAVWLVMALLSAAALLLLLRRRKA